MSQLPSRPDLSRLKKLARTLQRAAAKGSVEDLRRIRTCFPAASVNDVKLSQAQLVLAREYGSASWPELVARVERRVSRNDAAALRAAARHDDAVSLAARWLALAEAGDVKGLVAAFAVAKRRMVAARVLMQAQPSSYEQFLDVLLAGTSHPSPRIRFECIHALDSFGTVRCLETLIRLMDDPVPRVRWIAMHSVTCHACNESTCANDTAVHECICRAALTDESIQVRRHATVALGALRAASAVDALRVILAHDTDASLLRAANWALSQCRGAATSEPPPAV
jgi:hypothetical protein